MAEETDGNEDSIIEFALEDVIDAWLIEKLDGLRQELHGILAQVGARVLVDDDVELIDFEGLNEFLKENNDSE